MVDPELTGQTGPAQADRKNFGFGDLSRTLETNDHSYLIIGD